MHLNNFTSTAKQVSKITTKAKAALEDKATGASKKQKPNETRLNTITQLKKAKTYLVAGNTPTSGQSLIVGNNDQVTPLIASSRLITPIVSMNHHAIVCTEEEEEDTLYASEVDTDPKDSKSAFILIYAVPDPCFNAVGQSTPHKLRSKIVILKCSNPVQLGRVICHTHCGQILSSVYPQG